MRGGCRGGRVNRRHQSLSLIIVDVLCNNSSIVVIIIIALVTLRPPDRLGICPGADSVWHLKAWPSFLSVPLEGSPGNCQHWPQAQYDYIWALLELDREEKKRVNKGIYLVNQCSHLRAVEGNDDRIYYNITRKRLRKM